jgi:hypothetical protein
MKRHLGIKLRLILSALALSLGLGAVAFGQEITGTIVGTVKDTSGASVKGATVTVTDVDKKVVVRTVETGDSGEFSAALLPVGNYDVTVEAPNFKKHLESRVKLDVNQRRSIDVAMEPGNIAEVVTVTSEPLQVDTQTVTAGTLISGTQVRELSLNNRNFVQLTTLVPGVSSNLADQAYVGTTRPDGRVNIISISVNGSRSSANNWRVDGADITDRGSNLTIQLYPSVDAISEFKVLRSLYPAEEGRAAGGQINVITKSGTNEFHGSAFEFLRNDKLNANNFFVNSDSSPSNLDNNGKAKRPPLRYNDFGFTIGGPVYLPRFGEGGKSYWSGKNKTFFFFSQEWRRTITYTVFRPTVPNSQLKQGIFPVDVCVAVDAAGNCTQTGRRITNINPVAKAYINDIFSSLPEPGADFVLTSPQRNVFNFSQQIARIDHNFSSRLTASYRYERDAIPTIEANSLFSSGSELPGVSTTQTDSPGRSHTAHLTFTINPSTILEGGYAYTYGAIKSHPFGKLLLANSSVSVPLPFTNELGRIPTLAFNNLNATSTFGPYDNFSNNHNFFANLSKLWGTHTLKFGGTVGLLRKHENLAGGNEGSFSFAGDDIYQEWANFLLGNVDNFSQNSKDLTVDLRQWVNEFYGQDEWRVRPNLTLYYGARYSIFRRPYDKNGFFTNFDPRRFDPTHAFRVDALGNRIPGTGDPLNGIIVNSQNAALAAGHISQFGNKVANEDSNNVAPRIGLAWDPFKKGTTSVRAGYGLYYDLSTYAFYQDAAYQNPPFNTSISISNTRLDNPAAGRVEVDNSALSLIGVGLPFVTPYVQQWSLDVQHQFTPKTLLDVGYYGSIGTHLPGVIDINLLPPGFAATHNCVNSAGTTVLCQTPGVAFTSGSRELILDQIRPFRGYRSIDIVENRFTSNYHSMQVYFQQRLTGASQLNVAYTFSKNLTNNQTDRSTPPQDVTNIRGEYGRATLDRRHILTLNYVYDLPFFKQQRGFAGHLLGGWEVSGITTYETGLPFTVTRSRDPGGIGCLRAETLVSCRPDLIADPNSNAPQTVDQWFNKNAFVDVPNGQTRVGTAGRGVVNGPGLAKWDLSLFKNIRINENVRLQFRGEAFNVLNHTNFSRVFTAFTPTSTTFGKVRDAGDARIIQLGVKMYF